MNKLLKRIWNMGYIRNYVPLFPSDAWWNIWYLILCVTIGTIGSTIIVMLIKGKL